MRRSRWGRPRPCSTCSTLCRRRPKRSSRSSLFDAWRGRIASLPRRDRRHRRTRPSRTRFESVDWTQDTSTCGGNATRAATDFSHLNSVFVGPAGELVVTSKNLNAVFCLSPDGARARPATRPPRRDGDGYAPARVRRPDGAHLATWPHGPAESSVSRRWTRRCEKTAQHFGTRARRRCERASAPDAPRHPCRDRRAAALDALDLARLVQLHVRGAVERRHKLCRVRSRRPRRAIS